MPKAGQRQPWRVTFQYGTQDKANTRAHYTQDEAEAFAEELRQQAGHRNTTVTIKITNRDTGEIMAKNTETTEQDHAQTVEQIVANSERAVSLAEADNSEGLDELAKETETLISSLPSRGRFEQGDKPRSWAQVKKELRQQFREAAQARPKAEVTKAEPAAEVAPAKDYTEYEGVSELVSMGAERVAEGVRLHLKTSVTAKEIAEIILDMWRRIENKDGNPDITGKSDAAKKASSALYRAAGEALRGEDGFEVEQAVKSLMRSVQTQRTDVRAKYLRSLDEDTPEAEAERQHFAKLIEGKPEDMTVSEWLAHHYGVGLKGEIEKARERAEAQRKALESAKDDSMEEAPEADAKPADPEAEVRAAVESIRKVIAKVNPDTVESLSDEAKAKLREDLTPLGEAIKAMIKATI